MAIETIIAALQWIALIILGAFLAYYRTSSKLQVYVAGLIARAEAKYTEIHSGGVKFAFVCNHIYALVPLPLRKIITRPMVESLVQSTFDAMAAYAKMQLDRLVGQADALSGREEARE